MRTTMILDDALLARAMRLSGLSEKTAVVHAGLEALIARASAQRLARLGGTDPDASAGPRPRPEPATRRPARAGRGGRARG
jgi:Arc/MetJ family transcription regulator